LTSPTHRYTVCLVTVPNARRLEMNAAPKTNGEAYASNHHGYRDRVDAAAKACAEARQSDWYAEYLRANLPEEVAPTREP
jgi:hypothetical protein